MVVLRMLQRRLDVVVVIPRACNHVLVCQRTQSSAHVPCVYVVHSSAFRGYNWQGQRTVDCVGIRPVVLKPTDSILSSALQLAIPRRHAGFLQSPDRQGAMGRQLILRHGDDERLRTSQASGMDQSNWGTTGAGATVGSGAAGRFVDGVALGTGAMVVPWQARASKRGMYIARTGKEVKTIRNEYRDERNALSRAWRQNEKGRSESRRRIANLKL